MDIFNNVTESAEPWKPTVEWLRREARRRRSEADYFRFKRPDIVKYKRKEAEELDARADALEEEERAKPYSAPVLIEIPTEVESYIRHAIREFAEYGVFLDDARINDVLEEVLASVEKAR